jgi:CHAT domain-containing protein
LDQRIQDQRVALGILKLQASRAPETRGLDLGTPARRTLDEATLDLSKLLFAPPVAEALKKIRHLVVVPVHSLGVVPFAMLRPFGDRAVLIETMSVTVAPSLFDIEKSLREAFPPPDWGKATYTFETPLVVGLSEFPHKGHRDFPPLPGVTKELEAVAKELNAKPFLNSQATKRLVQSEAPAADLVYIASHGFADEKEGYLVLWPDDETDGIWSGQEIHDVRFENAYVAVLSACQTGLGRVHDAGVIGVARSFQMGGTPRVVVSLWSVKDDETAVFMTRLVRNMRKTMVAEALRETALEMRRDFPDPAVWASFTLFGTPR